ncbi:hypothetical protein A3Q56_05344 [Intoshia linei]|uniref:C2 domain-containing protein n=1 Tax=Intoshia linei TaxID=1819745 RepID=A0A177AY41_9BILA|nr:hypothetical protein A3Q56_05344 [Intoshia linei]
MNSEIPHTKIEISIKCTDLPKLDICSRSDPFYIFYTNQNTTEKKWQQIKKSRVISNCHNPEFDDRVIMTYYFESYQQCRIELYDDDNNGKSKDFIGYYEFVLGELVSSNNLKKDRFLLNKKNKPLEKKSKIYFDINEITGTAGTINFDIMLKNVPKKGLFKTNQNLNLKFYRSDNKLSYESTKSTSHIWKNLNFDLFHFCGGDLNSKIILHVLKSNVHFGQTFFTVCELFKIYNANDTKLTLDIINGEKPKLKVLCVIDVKSIIEGFSFLDFVRSAMQINMLTSIDFTYSNGYPPTLPNSLHNINQGTNQYVIAINSVGRIVVEYDHDKFLPCYGFGAKLTENSEANHCFNLRDNGNDCFGVEGILKAYYSRVTTVKFHGPTMFSPTLQCAEKAAKENHIINMEYKNSASNVKNFLQYTILLILTDGLITDLQETTKKIIDMSNLPLSIIIVGLGNADFSAMEFLDSDSSLLSIGSKTAVRDIVQFVKLLPFLSGQISEMYDSLAANVLAEIPNQVISYMRLHNLKPKTRDLM